MNRDKLRKLAMKASLNSHSPYSHANVGSALVTDSGEYYQGCNIENSSFGATVCAERVAIWKAISEGEKSIKAIYVYTKDGWPPCGLCLQVLSEFASSQTIIIIGDEQNNETQTTLKQLLPRAFTPDYLIK